MTLLLGLAAALAAPALADAQPAAEPASAQPAPARRVAAGATEATTPTRSTVLHVPPTTAEAEAELRIVAVVDAAWTEAALFVRYRARGSGEQFHEAPFERSSAGGYFASIPADAVAHPGLEYFIAGLLPSGEETPHFASAEAPHVVIVAPTQSERWAALERARLGGRASTVRADVWGHDFGNRFDKADQYLRGELDFTHRLLLPLLYSISLGYGAIQGETPDGVGSESEVDVEGSRYGYAGVRLRMSQSIWLDGHVAIGVSDNGFIVGGRALVTLGRPWRSSVNLGIEAFEDLGSSLWVRLQWETVPPFLMGATIMKSDLPGAVLEGGSYIAYDISYPVTERVLLRGSLSFGSRDGPGRFGGGLGTQFAF